MPASGRRRVVAFERRFGIVVSYRCERSLSQGLVVSESLSLALVNGKLVCRGSRNGLLQLLHTNCG